MVHANQGARMCSARKAGEKTSSFFSKGIWKSGGQWGGRREAGEAMTSTKSRGTNWPKRVEKLEKEVVTIHLFSLFFSRGGALEFVCNAPRLN